MNNKKTSVSKVSKKHLAIISLSIFTLTAGLSVIKLSLSRQVNAASQPPSLPIYSVADLSPYNGDDPDQPIYIGYEGLVYDVTAGSEFYRPGGPYHDLAGKDSTQQLHIAGGNIIKTKYPVVGKLK